MNNADMPAMPTPENLEGYYADPKTCKIFMPFMGLTKREYFAAKALQGMCADIVGAEMRGYDSGPDQTARDALCYADALLRELEKEQ